MSQISKLFIVVFISAFIIPLLLFEIFFWVAIAYHYFLPYLPLIRL